MTSRCIRHYRYTSVNLFSIENYLSWEPVRISETKFQLYWQSFFDSLDLVPTRNNSFLTRTLDIYSNWNSSISLRLCSFPLLNTSPVSPGTMMLTSHTADKTDYLIWQMKMSQFSIQCQRQPDNKRDWHQLLQIMSQWLSSARRFLVKKNMSVLQYRIPEWSNRTEEIVSVLQFLDARANNVTQNLMKNISQRKAISKPISGEITRKLGSTMLEAQWKLLMLDRYTTHLFLPSRATFFVIGSWGFSMYMEP